LFEQYLHFPATEQETLISAHKQRLVGTSCGISGLRCSRPRPGLPSLGGVPPQLTAASPRPAASAPRARVHRSRGASGSDGAGQTVPRDSAASSGALPVLGLL